MSEPGQRAVVRLTEAQRLDWLRLIRSEGVGPRTFRKLLNHFGGAAEALHQLPGLARSRGLPPPRIPERSEIEREVDAATARGGRFIACGEADYPPALAVIDDAPPILTVRGQASALRAPLVAIVGSRNASAAGLQMAQRLAAELGRQGFVIVSGLARGIDAKAHEAALDTGTVAVLAGGHDRIYPPEHADLVERIVERGAVLSEMPWTNEPRGRDFPRRNRLVSGVSLGVVLVEAARKSGSLITARFALEQGREVFAVPGSPLDPRAEGTNDLLRQGATMVTASQDVSEVLAPLIGRPAETAEMGEAPHVDIGSDDDGPLYDEVDFLSEPPPPGYRTERAAGQAARPASDASDRRGIRVTAAEEETQGPRETLPADGRSPERVVEHLLGPSPVSVDELVRCSALSARQVQVALFDLEQRGLLERHGRSLVSLRPKAER